MSAGQATITAKSTADATKTATIAVTVTGTVRITSVTPSPVSLQIGQQTKLTPAVQADPGISATVKRPVAERGGRHREHRWHRDRRRLGQTGMIVAAVADPTQRVIVPVTVGDPCQIQNPLIIGTTREGRSPMRVRNKLVDLYSYTVSAQTAITLGATLQFRGSFALITHRTGWFSSAIYTGNGEGAWKVIVAPGTYEAFIKAEDATSRGAYSITTSRTMSFASVCGVVATTGVTVMLPLNGCGFQPASRPAGFYRSFGISKTPALAPDQRMTITVTASGSRRSSKLASGRSPIMVVAPVGSNTVVQSFVGPPGNNVVFFTVSSVDPGQAGTFSVKIEGPPNQSATVRTQVGQTFRSVMTLH